MSGFSQNVGKSGKSATFCSVLIFSVSTGPIGFIFHSQVGYDAWNTFKALNVAYWHHLIPNLGKSGKSTIFHSLLIFSVSSVSLSFICHSQVGYDAREIMRWISVTYWHNVIPNLGKSGESAIFHSLRIFSVSTGSIGFMFHSQVGYDAWKIMRGINMSY